MRIAIGLALICTLAAGLALAQGSSSGVSASPLGQANLRAEASIESARLGEIRAGTAYPILGRSQFYPWLLLGAPDSGAPNRLGIRDFGFDKWRYQSRSL